MKHQNYATVTNQRPGKSHNEDWARDWSTIKGHIFFVVDFASFSHTTLNLTLQRNLEEIISDLDKLPGLSVDTFLGHVAKELNNFVFAFGQDYCDGKLFCVVAIALLHGNKLYYLTYGDSRINIFTDDKLLLLNGAKYQARSLISDSKDTPSLVRENPEQMGRSLFEMPLTDRVRSFTLSDDDVVLMFSDGLEENVTPQRRLSELRTLGKSEPRAICEAMFKISADLDDRTITVIAGPYKLQGDSLFEQVNRTFQEFDKRMLTVESACQRQMEINTDLHKTLGALPNNYLPKSELSNLTKQLTSESSDNKVASLEKRIEKLETNNGKLKGRSGGGPVVFTLDQTVYDTIREIVNANPVKESKQTGSAGSSEQNLLIKKKVQHGKSEPESGILRLLSNQIVGIVSIFVFGMIALWLLQAFSSKIWPERWVARTEGESLIVQRNDYFSTGPTFSVRLQPPVPIVTQQASSFEELAPLIGSLQGAKPPDPVPSVTNRNENSAVPTETVQTVTAQARDTLGKLAKRHNTTEDRLKELNPNIKWETLQVGQEIRVPITNVNIGNPQK